MDILIIIVLAVMVVAFRLLKLGSWFSPWTLTAAIWLGIMILIQLQGDMLYPLTDQFRISLALWVPILCGSALITYHGMGVREANDTSHATQSGASFSPLLYNLLYVISMVLTPLMLLQIIKVVSQFDATDLLFNIRTLAVEGEQNYGFLLYSFVLNQVLLVVGLWEYPRVPLWQLLTIYLATFLNFFAILEKGILFFALVCTLFVLYEKKGHQGALHRHRHWSCGRSFLRDHHCAPNTIRRHGRRNDILRLHHYLYYVGACGLRACCGRPEHAVRVAYVQHCISFPRSLWL